MVFDDEALREIEQWTTNFNIGYCPITIAAPSFIVARDVSTIFNDLRADAL